MVELIAQQQQTSFLETTIGFTRATTILSRRKSDTPFSGTIRKGLLKKLEGNDRLLKFREDPRVLPRVACGQIAPLEGAQHSHHGELDDHY